MLTMWDDSDAFAGMGSTGADKAWYTAALSLEHAQVFDQLFCAGAVGVYKCFDQLVPELIQMVALRCGMDLYALSAYSRYHAHDQCRFVMACGVGASFSKRCGIPQGCPLSMRLLGLLLIPWQAMVRACNARPRMLADGLLVTTDGDQHEHDFVEAMEITSTFVQDIRSKVAPSKS